MNTCWLLIVARGLSVWLPPEIYMTRKHALKEADQWRAILRIPSVPKPLTATSKALQIVRSRFPDPWRACPMWAGVTWSESSYPRMRVQLIAADDGEATDWLRKHTPKSLGVREPGQHMFERRGVHTAVGVFRTKRVVGL